MNQAAMDKGLCDQEIAVGQNDPVTGLVYVVPVVEEAP